MKNTTIAWMLGFSLILISAAVGYAVETPDAINEHLALAASYEEKVAAQDALIAEHTKMKADYKSRFFVNEKVTPMDKILEMEEHCDAIIEAAQIEKNQLLDYARWHRMRASELQGL